MTEALVVDVHHSTTTPATHQAAQQRGTAFHSTSPEVGRDRRVLLQLLLVAFKLGPGDVTLMMFMNHRLPLRRITKEHALTLGGTRTVLAFSTSSVDEGAGVSRIIQERQNSTVGWLEPDQIPQTFRRQIQAFLLMMEQDLPSTAQLRKRSEYPGHGLLHALIRMLLDAIVLGPHISGRNSRHDDPAFDFSQERLLGALPQKPQLKLAHRPFESQEQSIIEQPRIVDAIVVNH